MLMLFSELVQLLLNFVVVQLNFSVFIELQKRKQ